MNAQYIEQATAEALLDVGVSVPVRVFRLPLSRRSFTLRLTMRRPYLGGLIRIAREFLQMGITFEEVDALSREEQLSFIANHGKGLSRIIALTLCRGKWSGKFCLPLLAWWLRHSVEPIYLCAAFTRFVALLGLGDFGNIIKSCAALNPMQPTIKSQQTGRG